VRGAEATIRSIVVDVQFVAYIVMALVLVARYQRALVQSQSSIEKSSLSWLRTLLFGYTIINLPYLLKHFIFLFTGTFDESLILVNLFGNLAFVTALVLKGLHHSELFAGLESPPVKYGRSLLPETQRAALLAKLGELMEREKPFLEPDLTLQDLAGRLAVTPHQLSQILNDGLRQSFYDFVNGYRVRESQHRLAAAPQSGKTVLEVLYETGFNSKSTFNSVFKKHTGMTPTEFRNTQARASS
jgi:AraC-like DNA-binding protein